MLKARGTVFSRKPLLFELFLIVLVQLAVVSLVASLPVGAAQVTLAWDPNQEPDLAGYNVYWGPASRDYPHRADVGTSTSFVISGVEEGRIYYFAVTAYDTDGSESTYSIELAYAVPVTDSDGDLVSDTDEINIYGTDPNVQDTDQDGMDDGWEISAGLDPLNDDASDDVDGDGITNMQAYIAWLQTGNSAPDKPFLNVPYNNQLDVAITPFLQTGVFSDPDTGDFHAMTRWQISTEADFADVVFDLKTEKYLTSLPVPDSLINGNQTYHWRVQFLDNRYGASIWSDVFSFTTVDMSTFDLNGNGIPDNQEVVGSMDLDQNGIPDSSQDDIACVNSATANIQIGLKCDTGCATIDTLKSVATDDLIDTAGRLLEFPLGLISFRTSVPSPGDTATVQVFFSEAAPLGTGWYKYTPAMGWHDYSEHAAFSADGKSVTFEIKDGGFGDADGVANGVIVDPAGLNMVSYPSSSTVEGSGGGCFIDTSEELRPAMAYRARVYLFFQRLRKSVR
jgi:hypothetical protein